jgi:hypothetical protein
MINLALVSVVRFPSGLAPCKIPGFHPALRFFTAGDAYGNASLKNGIISRSAGKNVSCSEVSHPRQIKKNLYRRLHAIVPDIKALLFRFGIISAETGAN